MDLITTQENAATNLPQLEVEIKFYLGQTAQNIIEVGKRLIAAKSLVAHGQWQAWLKNNFQLTYQTAAKFIQCAERFSNVATSRDLNRSQMIEMLSLPDAEETEKFIAEKAAEGKAVADMTIKQLREEIARYKATIDDERQMHQQNLFDRDNQISNLEKELAERPTVAPEDYQQTKDALVDAKVALELAKDAAQRQADDFKKQSDEATDKLAKAKKEIAKLKNADERRERKAYTPPTELPTDKFKLFCADIRNGLPDIADNSVDFIITDPPYPKEFLPLYEDLSKVAARVLKDGGSLICMAGQSYLPEVIRLLSTSLNYHWCLSYLTPGGQSAQLFQRRVNTFWKPVLWFVKGDYFGGWTGDVLKSSVNDNDKRFHEWGQSVSGMKDIIERLTCPNDIILDPFLGGGTTGLVALTSGRKFIGVDVEQSCVDTTLNRIREVFDVAGSCTGADGMAG